MGLVLLSFVPQGRVATCWGLEWVAVCDCVSKALGPEQADTKARVKSQQKPQSSCIFLLLSSGLGIYTTLPQTSKLALLDTAHP